MNREVELGRAHGMALGVRVREIDGDFGSYRAFYLELLLQYDFFIH